MKGHHTDNFPQHALNSSSATHRVLLEHLKTGDHCGRGRPLQCCVSGVHEAWVDSEWFNNGGTCPGAGKFWCPVKLSGDDACVKEQDACQEGRPSNQTLCLSHSTVQLQGLLLSE